MVHPDMIYARPIVSSIDSAVLARDGAFVDVATMSVITICAFGAHHAQTQQARLVRRKQHLRKYSFNVIVSVSNRVSDTLQLPLFARGFR